MHDSYIDFASNDYLALAHNKKNAKKAFAKVLKYSQFGAKASQLINGYSAIHAKFENLLAKTFGFEASLLFGSGYLANLALASTLARREDIILMDDEYHASGKVGVKLSQAQCIFFKHNDADDLKSKLQAYKNKEVFIFVEGVYSMIGDKLNPQIIDIANAHNAWLVIDEAHSVGVLGADLLGVYSAFNQKPNAKHIKMGTFSKAIGSYGAYVVCSDIVSQYLQNRANSLIYTTGLSLFDTSFAMQNFKYILNNGKKLASKLLFMRDEIGNVLNKKIDSQIVMIDVNVEQIKKELEKEKISVGYIRPPTVITPMLRITLRLGESEQAFKRLLECLAI